MGYDAGEELDQILYGCDKIKTYSEKIITRLPQAKIESELVTDGSFYDIKRTGECTFAIPFYQVEYSHYTFEIKLPKNKTVTIERKLFDMNDLPCACP
jgi:hypothetical protein